MPTLFEILNRFSRPPVDLWSFYVFLKEQYGGVEYLEFWIDCAAYSALYQEVEESVKFVRCSELLEPTPLHDDTRILSRDSSVLMEMLGEGSGSGNTTGNTTGGSTNANGTALHGATNGGPRGQSSVNGTDNSRIPGASPVATEAASNTPGTTNAAGAGTSPPVSSASPLRRQALGPLEELPLKDAHEADVDEKRARNKRESVFWLTAMLRRMRGESDTYESPATAGIRTLDIPDESHFTHPNGRPTSYASQLSVTRRTMHESVQRIVSLYLTPGGAKQIELPSTGAGWSLAEEIRELIACPGGLDAPDIFEKATTYVFEVLEREALPAFLVSRALANIQPVSATLRLIAGLVALFGAFWLSFVFVLLDWQPKSTRCWVILPFALGWYFAASSLYRIDPILSMLGYAERDGGGVAEIHEPFVYGLMYRRGLFVLGAVAILSACFSVLFIFVPGYRL